VENTETIESVATESMSAWIDAEVVFSGAGQMTPERLTFFAKLLQVHTEQAEQEVADGVETDVAEAVVGWIDNDVRGFLQLAANRVLLRTIFRRNLADFPTCAAFYDFIKTYPNREGVTQKTYNCRMYARQHKILALFSDAEADQYYEWLFVKAW